MRDKFNLGIYVTGVVLGFLSGVCLGKGMKFIATEEENIERLEES